MPVYKNGSKLECPIYRPISLLSNIEKVLERRAYNRLVSFTIFSWSNTETFTILWSNSFNWQNKRATRQWTFWLGILVVFQKDFDAVDHDFFIK